jgi:hypothetical protein
MDWQSLIGPAVVAAAVSGAISFISMIISTRTARQLHSERLDAEQRLLARKFEFDKELAQRKFNLDRSQLIQKRRFELAETLLADAYRFRDLMAFVRNSAAFGAEGETRQCDGYESEQIKKLRNYYFVPVERLQKESEFISSLMAREHTAHAHFGPDAKTAFQLLGQSIGRVRAAAWMLIESAGNERDRDTMEKMRAEIWAPLASFRGKDEISAEISEAVLIIEKLCGPALEWEGG